MLFLIHLNCSSYILKLGTELTTIKITNMPKTNSNYGHSSKINIPVVQKTFEM